MFGLFNKKTDLTTHIKKTKTKIDDYNEYEQGDKISQHSVSEQLNGIYHSLDWYKKQYAKLSTTLLALICLLFSSVLSNVGQFITRPAPVYFQVDTNLRLTEIKPLTEPMLTNEDVLNWTSSTIVKTLSIDFVHYREDLGRVKNDYTKKSFKELVESLTKQDILGLIKEKNLVVKVELLKAPTILNSGVSDNAMTWKIEFPITLDYLNGKGSSNSQALLTTVLVQRASILEYEKGIIIKQVLFSPYTKE